MNRAVDAERAKISSFLFYSKAAVQVKFSWFTRAARGEFRFHTFARGANVPDVVVGLCWRYL